MDARIAEFRTFVDRARQGRRSGASPYPKEARSLAILLTQELTATGQDFESVAKTLGVAPQTLDSWLQGGSPVLRPVCSSSEELGRDHAKEEPVSATPGRPVVVLPSGIRVEGLSLEGVIAVLRGLS